MVGGPIATGAAPPKQPAPALGEDTDAILIACGYSTEEIAALRSDGVI
jgi:crotonobetainyl-CoA:carnitine CoA-transferase CaiB-like acyl-CoA transferase